MEQQQLAQESLFFGVLMLILVLLFVGLCIDLYERYQIKNQKDEHEEEAIWELGKEGQKQKEILVKENEENRSLLWISIY